ncbi:hypothetical protein CcaverHIS002_0113010 [Cutaneotrichosporon cavernicola]|uniref:Uncharacterized protein n=1 Tax=Cutaneotrichosporon cavernicola TaxID=279322 RepID=A0AA48HZT0_9TREE|nr:uncharacterized protein CcaverHIS019_0112870 [Cutaneotrichosporon cavernicola]BEI80772.1 hypothetical protein CcaverHIS002_0113010 [Cutaneotrichosporon cavernicola]BEI88569.1 hypothetical protein CcaverHIS019_0112870 [Cutaneotrichosporon cavernicola]BEI96342.1 hypothetical protein CcaverHIS631_0112910 [Cutaneotrichosporon cavernicola]BEJ04114.1 hypothetical protein CcaverHIS641_0112890 [Cutaneotrichosporon cavernicola]
MFFASLFTAVLAATAYADGLTFLNATTAGSQITFPTANTTIPLNGTLYVNWEWKEDTSPKLMVLLANKNTTIFHPAGHTPVGTSLSGKGLFDTQERVLANMTTVSFGPVKPPGDTSINAGGTYQVVLAWDNKGEDAATNPYFFLASPNFTIGPKAAQELPDSVKPWNAPPASSAVGAGLPALFALVAVGVAALA